MKKYNSRENKVSPVANFLLNAIFWIYAATCIYPILLIAGTSIASQDAITQFGYSAFPKEIDFAAYEYIFKNGSDILHAYGVTIFVTIVGALCSTSMIALYAYPLSRKEFKYKKFFTFFLFFTMLFNGGLVPWYLVCTRILHIQNTIFALFVPALLSAWNVIIMRTFFQTTVPDAIIESSRIDGASEFRTFLTIVIPISLPGLATIGLFATLGFWNDWWLSMMLTTKAELINLQFYLFKVIMNIQILNDSSANSIVTQSGDIVSKIPQEGARMALCMIAIGPIILAYPFFQKFFVQGLTIGAVKG